MSIEKMGSPATMPRVSPAEPNNVENSSGPSIVKTSADALIQQRGSQEFERPSRSDIASRMNDSGLSGQSWQVTLNKKLTENRADAIFKAFQGLDRDDQALYRSLSGLNPKQCAELNQVYKQKYGMSLEDQLRGELIDSELGKGLISTNKETTTTEPVLSTDQKIDIAGHEPELKMQMVIDRKAKVDNMASNLGEKLHDTIVTILTNLK